MEALTEALSYAYVLGFIIFIVAMLSLVGHRD